ncbi:synaptic vesicle glycoprotein 2B-like isoform X2 [Zophobas morio]|uniref:synaptic vesicle glycoprotein 2B-like isoform X2 n=1 Tax=Zophobas morio TaxID=2755281 RepID=UPI0030831791
MVNKEVEDNIVCPSVINENQKCTTPDPGNVADFETAIAQTKFGTFNLILLLVAIPSVFASQFETASLSYAFPAAQCDLNLSLEDRGLVNAIIYTGMISSCFIWGSLVDVFGRRRILIITHLIDSVFVIMAAFAPNLSVLLVAKFFGGFVINGPSMALTPYLSEFHGTQYRSRVPLTLGLLYSVGNIFLPLLAWALLPLNININVFEGFELHAWNIFLLICTLPALTSGLFFLIIPESPKYLMSKGNNENALEIFQQIFKLNTRQDPEQYPVKKLKDDKQIYQQKYTLKEAWIQISPLFSLRYANKLLLVCLLEFFLMMGTNSLRLWLPQIFQLINDYILENNESGSFCSMLNTLQSTANNDETCLMNFDNSSVYINSIIVAFTAVVGYFIAAFCINKLGKKKILAILGTVSGTAVLSIYFAPNSTSGLILICIYLMCTCVCIDVVIAIAVDLFPTYLRASALSLVLMSGRLGSIVGNLIFPILLQVGCGAPFFTLGGITISCIIISLFLPNTDLKALE